MKIKELKLKSDTELNNLLTECHDKLRDMRFRVAQRQLKKVSDIKTNKKTIAQILTIQKQRQQKATDENEKEMKN